MQWHACCSSFIFLTLFQTELQTDKYKNKEEISTLEGEVESLTTQLENEQRKASRLQSQLDEVNPRYSTLKRDKKQLQQELAALRQNLDINTVCRLQFRNFCKEIFFQLRTSLFSAANY